MHSAISGLIASADDRAYASAVVAKSTAVTCHPRAASQSVSDPWPQPASRARPGRSSPSSAVSWAFGGRWATRSPCLCRACDQRCSQKSWSYSLIPAGGAACRCRRSVSKRAAPQDCLRGTCSSLPRLHHTLQRLEVLPQLTVGCPLLKWLQQLEQATRLDVRGPRVTRALGRLFKGRMPLVVRDWSTHGSIRIAPVSFIGRPLVGRFEATTYRLDGHDEPVALPRWTGRLFPHSQHVGHPLRVVVHVGDVVEHLLQWPIDFDASLDTHGGMPLPGETVPARSSQSPRCSAGSRSLAEGHKVWPPRTN